jgi:hypothetical protein
MREDTHGNPTLRFGNLVTSLKRQLTHFVAQLSESIIQTLDAFNAWGVLHNPKCEFMINGRDDEGKDMRV